MRQDTWKKFPMAGLFLKSVLPVCEHLRFNQQTLAFYLPACFPRCRRYRFDFCVGTFRVPLRKFTCFPCFLIPREKANRDAGPVAT